MNNKNIGEQKSGEELATLAGGCFWCMVPPFINLPGVIQVVAGYTGGTTENPSYEEVCYGKSGHIEAVQITLTLTRPLMRNCWKSTGSRLIPLTRVDNLPIAAAPIEPPFSIIMKNSTRSHKL